MTTRIARITTVGVVSAVIALVAGSLALARDGAAAPRAIFCGATGSGPAEALATVPGAAWLREGANAKDRWYLLVTSNTPCDEARALVPELTAKAVSRGTVARAAAVIRGWHCTIDRDSRSGGCSVLLGGSPRYLVVYPQNDLGLNGSMAIYRNLIGLDVITPTAEEPPGGATPGPAPTPDPDRYSGAPAQRCTALEGPRWQYSERAPAGWPRNAFFPSGATGTRWRVWALGGFSCLAAQSWVADLAPRVIRNFTGMGGLRTETQWVCMTGGGELLVGLCQRGPSPRGLFDHRGLVIAPDAGAGSLPFQPASYEEVWHAMLSFNATAEVALTRGQVCLDRQVASARWTVGTESGTRWIVGGVGGYICGFLLNGGLDRLATFAAATGSPSAITGGVGGQWRCTRNAGAKLRCYYPTTGTKFRITLQPYLRSRPHEEIEAEVLRSLR